MADLPVDSQDSCESLCSNTVGCQVYTFDPNYKYCYLFESCPDCVSLTPGSTPSTIGPTTGTSVPEDEQLLMVVPRFEPAEVHSLTPDENPLPPCLENLSDQAFGEFTAGAALSDGTPIVCGGAEFEEYNHTEVCSLYDPLTDSWTESGTMLQKRSRMAYYFHPSLGLIMAGGYDESDIIDGVERTTDGQNFISMPPLPNANKDQCMVVTDEGTIYITGGISSDVRMYSLNPLSGQDSWVQEPSMKTGRSSHGCGLIKGDNGTEIVVVGGDFASGDDVEIFNINNREWRTGPLFPFGISIPASTPYKESFLIVGGGIRGNIGIIGISDTIYYFNPRTFTWDLMEESLNNGQWAHTAFMVDSSIFPPCEK